jgi:hypothetical protein
MSDKEDATAPLRYSGKLSVKNPVASKIPALANGGEEGGEVTVLVSVHHALSVSESSELVASFGAIAKRTLRFCASAVRGQEAGDVLEDHPAGPEACNNPKADEGQVAARAIHSDALPGDGEVLAGGAPNNDIWAADGEGPLDEVFGIDVSKVHGFGVARLHGGAGKLLDLGVPEPGPPGHRDLWSSDATEEGCGLHAALQTLALSPLLFFRRSPVGTIMGGVAFASSLTLGRIASTVSPRRSATSSAVSPMAPALTISAKARLRRIEAREVMARAASIDVLRSLNPGDDG